MAEDELKQEDVWKDDLLGRSEDAQFLIDFLDQRVAERGVAGNTKSYVLNLDARWGEGKTFFLKRLMQQLTQKNYLVAYVNAWEDDHADDPLIAVMSSVDEIMESYLEEKPNLRTYWDAVKKSAAEVFVAALKHGSKKMLGKIFGGAVEEAEEIIRDKISTAQEGEDTGVAIGEGGVASESMEVGIDRLQDAAADKILKNFRKSRRSIELFRENLCTLLRHAAHEGEIKVPLFVLVDELDRCRPPFAIAMLERVKHLFDTDDVVFIVATDSEQLRHSISVVYGQEFDAKRYLLRFFDRTYQFDEPEKGEFIESQISNHRIDLERLSSPLDMDNREFLIESMKNSGLSLRDIEQCFDFLRNVITTWKYKIELELIYLLPLIFSFQQGRMDFFQSLSNHQFDIEHWNVSERNYDIKKIERNPRGEPGEVHYNVLTLLKVFLSLLSNNIYDNMRPTDSSTSGVWIGRRFSAEYATRQSVQIG